eukprot:m.259524 g.259524  ORF g.259524 m.259524 type:complete len:69 (-) comp22732_c0_seq6:193-399(-)
MRIFFSIHRFIFFLPLRLHLNGPNHLRTLLNTNFRRLGGDKADVEALMNAKDINIEEMKEMDAGEIDF